MDLDLFVRAVVPPIAEAVALVTVLGATVLAAKGYESARFTAWRERRRSAAGDRRFARRTSYIGRAD